MWRTSMPLPLEKLRKPRAYAPALYPPPPHEGLKTIPGLRGPHSFSLFAGAFALNASLDSSSLPQRTLTCALVGRRHPPHLREKSPREKFAFESVCKDSRLGGRRFFEFIFLVFLMVGPAVLGSELFYYFYEVFGFF
jgi:hypothetical protein